MFMLFELKGSKVPKTVIVSVDNIAYIEPLETGCYVRLKSGTAFEAGDSADGVLCELQHNELMLNPAPDLMGDG